MMQKSAKSLKLAHNAHILYKTKKPAGEARSDRAESGCQRVASIVKSVLL